MNLVKFRRIEKMVDKLIILVIASLFIFALIFIPYSLLSKNSSYYKNKKAICRNQDTYLVDGTTYSCDKYK